jgi:DNA-binding CsgD family transcriptional regulator
MMLATNYINYQAENSLKKLIDPLTKMGNIHYFSYNVYYPETESCLLLTNSNNFLESWLEHFPLAGFAIKSGWKLWESHLPCERIEFGNQRDIGKGIYFVNSDDTKIEVFSFGSKPDNDKIYNFYLNNQNLLKRFTHYFRKKAEDFLIVGKEKLAKVPPKMIIKDPSEDSSLAVCQKTNVMTDLIRTISHPFNTLSKRESECYCLLVKGFSIAEIARLMQLSSNTIDVYVSRLKGKLNCNSKRELIQKSIDNGLIEYYLDNFKVNV